MRNAVSIGLAAAFALATAGSARAQCVEPSMLVLFDSSGSLGSKGNASSNYNAAVSAVLGLASAVDDQIRAGLLLFPAAPDAFQCTMSSELVVPYSLGASSAFAAFFDGYAGPTSKSDTPMLQALKVVDDAPPLPGTLGALKSAEAAGYVLLITDGIQDCCADELAGTGWGWDTEADCKAGVSFSSPDYYVQAELEDNRAELVQLVANLQADGLLTFVVGFGQKVDPAALDAMAKAGGTARAPGCGTGTAAGPCYYQADDPAELALVLLDISDTVTDEVCNGLDDDCDGATDEGLTKVCQAACGAGESMCADGVWGPCPVPEPQPESCNGADDNCDGEVDEGLIQDCSTACGTGFATCEDGGWVDCTAPQPETETCNAIDDDCDGSTDEGCACLDGATEPCGLSLGACEPGLRTCDGGVWSECEGGQGKVAETCNGKDDDCDGVADGIERSCATSCGGGIEKCIDGNWVGCTATPPQLESCNGADDDCDGEVDEDLERPCQTICAQGTEACEAGEWIGCSAKAPTQEQCNGLDDDCNGHTDDELALACEHACGAGVRECEGGAYGDCEPVDACPDPEPDPDPAPDVTAGPDSSDPDATSGEPDTFDPPAPDVQAGDAEPEEDSSLGVSSTSSGEAGCSGCDTSGPSGLAGSALIGLFGLFAFALLRRRWIGSAG
jgi:MYXO-CTERM domain-containing protein